MRRTSIRELRWQDRNLAAVLLIWLTVFLCPDAIAKAQLREQLVLIDINQQKLNETVVVLEDSNGLFYLSALDLMRWRLRLPNMAEAVSYQGKSFFSLNAIRSVSSKYDLATLSLQIQMPPGAFNETVESPPFTQMPLPAKPGKGGYLNYELFESASSGPESRQITGQFDVGYFNDFGVGTGSVLVNNAGSGTVSTRLETTWTSDFPDRMQTLRLGDATSVAGAWGRAVRFGGIQFGTDFGTQPGFDTFPQQSITGMAILPSTVDVLIDNALVSSQRVPPGPFTINNLPVITGAGTVQLVVRDLFGRQQIISRPLYASNALLREGLDDFSYEVGFVRDNFGLASDDYGPLLGSATFRRGMSADFTVELRAEMMRDQTTAGIGGDYLVPRLGTLSAYVAGSQSNAGSGYLGMLGIDRLAEPWSFSGHTLWTTREFAQIGLQVTELPPLQTSMMNLSYATQQIGSFGAGYVTQSNRDSPSSRIGTLNYSVSLGRAGALTLSVLRSFAGDPTTTLFALLSISLGSSTSLSGSFQAARGGTGVNTNDVSSTLQRNLPLGSGYGYQLQAHSNGMREGSYALQNDVGTYSIDVAQNQGTNAVRLDVSGGVVMMGDDVFLSRRIDQSFAVVSIPDYPGVHVLTDNQAAGITNANGDVLIPRLRAYDLNMITIDETDLPMDAEIDATRLPAVPYFRSGVRIEFPIKHAHGVTMTIHLEDGKPVSAGATIRIVGNTDSFVVGYGGQAYVDGLDANARMRVTWQGQACEFDIKFTKTTDMLPDLGTFICKRAKP